jgi:hypothetical protein
MTTGAVVLSIACLDALLQNLAGREPAYRAAEQAADIQARHIE